MTLSEPTLHPTKLWAAFFAGMALMSGLRIALAHSQGHSPTSFDLLSLVIGSTLGLVMVALRRRASRG